MNMQKTAAWGYIIWMVAIAIAIIWTMIHAAHAFDHGFNKQSPETKWFEKQLIPPKNEVSCCGKADAYPVDRYEKQSDGSYKVWIAEGYDLPYPDGTRRKPWNTSVPIIVPPAQVNDEKDDLDNPTEYSWLFFVPAQTLDADGNEVPSDHPVVIYCFIRHPQGI